MGLAGVGLYPLALSLLMPVFMYSIVMEKEERLIEIMKMNGLKMGNYWIMNYLFNLMIYTIAASVFFIFGYTTTDLPFFT